MIYIQLVHILHKVQFYNSLCSQVNPWLSIILREKVNSNLTIRHTSDKTESHQKKHFIKCMFEIIAKT